MFIVEIEGETLTPVGSNYLPS